MKKNLIIISAFLIICGFGIRTSSAQFPITIPKIPKIKKDKPQPPPPATDNNQSNDNQSNNNQPKNTQSNDSQTSTSEPSKPDDICTDWWAKNTLKDINTVQEDVDSFTPDRAWFVGDYTYNHLYFAISQIGRDNFYKDSKAPYKNCPVLVAAYKKLSDSAVKKLPLFVANKRDYAIQNPATAKLMHSKISDINDFKIFYTGVKEANWLIDKNEYGLPTARYKHGLVWLRNTKSSHPHCLIYYINIVQDYAGGGTYGESYGNYVKYSFAGCPAGEK